MSHMNSRIEGLKETEAARRYFGIAATYTERWIRKQPSPANSQIRLAYRMAVADPGSPNGGSRQQDRARAKPWKKRGRQA